MKTTGYNILQRTTQRTREKQDMTSYALLLSFFATIFLRDISDAMLLESRVVAASTDS